ncbi:hypothetical protein PybrP1_010844, partial [[Pythium] brassicae (nom. inval.)]
AWDKHAQITINKQHSPTPLASAASKDSPALPAYTMRVFVSDLASTFGQELVRYCQDANVEVVGTVANKAQLGVFKRRIQEHAASDKPTAVKEPVALASDKLAWAKLIKASTVVITSLAGDTKLAMEMLKVHEKRDESADADTDADADGADGSSSVKKFIAISSVLTWSKNAAFAKETSPEGPVAHQEDAFKTRKPARKYAELKTAETQVLSANRPDELETYLVAAGLVYGGAQTSFHLVFRDAWMYPTRDLLVPSLPGGSAKSGENLLPMISVYDLAILTFRLASAAGPQPKSYLLAVDKASRTTTLRDVCCGVSILLGNGRLRDFASADEADELVVEEDDGLVAPLQLHVCFNTDDALMNQLVGPDEWRHYETGLLGNLEFFVSDFIEAMDLRPLKTVVLGPPRAGKTLLSRKLAKDYYLPYISLQSVVDEVLPPPACDAQQQESTPGEGGAAVPASIDPVNDDLAKAREAVREWKEAGKSLKELSENSIVDVLRWKLSGAACRNQGYVLDGLPVTEAQAMKVFELLGHKSGGEGEGEGGEEGSGDGDNPADGESAEKSDADDEGGSDQALGKSRSKALLAQLRPRRQVQLPNRVVVLDAPRPVLEKRAQQLSEEDAEASGNTQTAFDERHAEFSAQVEALATFFERKRGESQSEDGIEVLELHLESEDAFRDTEHFHDAVKAYLEQGGKTAKPPCNFHPTRDEIRQMQRELEAKRVEDDARMRKQAMEQEEKDAADLEARVAAERARLELIQREESELLEARAKPLRAYLMDTVLPALTEGMLEVVKVQPDDPIDYLAEFLFRKGRELEE